MFILKKIVNLIIVGVTVFILLKITTFGWRFSFTSTTYPKPKDFSLVKRLKNHVYKLSEEIGNRNVFDYGNLENAENYIAEQFMAYGYDVQFQAYAVEGREVKNIFVAKKGTKLPDEIIVVGAHYDSCFNPGADDNASGVAGLLELARIMKDQDTNKTLKFIAFTNEEPPFFLTEQMGSRVYAKEAKIRNENVKAVLILEMLGCYVDKMFSQRYPPFFGIFYPNKGSFISVVGNFSSAKLVGKIKHTFKNQSNFPIESVATFGFLPGVYFSDHWSFWQEGYPAVMITDTAFLRYKHYHINSDTWEKLNYENMGCVVEGLYSVVNKLAE